MWPRRLGSEAVWVSVCHAHLQAAGAVGSLRIGRPAVVNEKPLGNLLHSLSRDMLHLKPLRIKKIGWSACQRNNSQSMSRAGQTVFDNSVVHADCAASKPLLAKSSKRASLRAQRNYQQAPRVLGRQGQHHCSVVYQHAWQSTGMQGIICPADCQLQGMRASASALQACGTAPRFTTLCAHGAQAAGCSAK